MTEKRSTPDASAGKSRRKRAAPTIDLKATEVRPVAAAGEPPVQDFAQEFAQEPAQESVKEQPAQESAAGADRSAGETGRGAGSKNTGLLLAAGAAGAAAMSLVLLGLWLTGLVPIRYAGSTATRARVTALEMQMQDLQKRPAQTAAGIAVDSKAVEALGARVATIEDAIGKIAKSPPADPALAERVAAADNAMKSLGVALAALNRRDDGLAAEVAQAQQRAASAEKAVTELRAGLQDVSKTASAGASSADLAPLQQRVAALEQSAKAAQAEIGRIAGLASASDQAARLALSAAALRDAVLRGAPFADELAQARSLGGDDKALAVLAPFAAGGVPGDKALAQELGALLPAMNKAAGAPAPSGGFIERLQANAGQLVRIRPLDAPAGDNTSAILARIEIAAAHADIAAALTDLGKLNDTQRAPAQAWIAKAGNRQAALAAARRFAADTARSLGSR